jgi:hypothetical protein
MLIQISILAKTAHKYNELEWVDMLVAILGSSGMVQLYFRGLSVVPHNAACLLAYERFYFLCHRLKDGCNFVAIAP